MLSKPRGHNLKTGDHFLTTLRSGAILCLLLRPTRYPAGISFPVAKTLFSSALTVFSLLGDSDECMDFRRADVVFDSGFGVSDTSTSSVVSFSGRGRTFGSASLRTPSVADTNS